MAFQTAVISAVNGLLATPAVGASNAAPATGDAGLFQSLLAGATGQTPAMAAAPNAAVQAPPASGALALLLQTQDAQPAQTAATVTVEASPAATTMSAAFTPATADGASAEAPPKSTPQTTPAPQNAGAQAALQTDQASAPAPAATVVVEAEAATDAPAQAAPAQPPPAATPQAPQAIVFAPFAAAQVSAALAPAPLSAAAPAAATLAKNAAATAIEADAPLQSGQFKKTTFTAQTKTEPFNAAVSKITGEALAAPQPQTPARAETTQAGGASPITGFDAPRAATESISTPIARAMHGAAAMQVAQHVARRFDGQSASFEVRLDPAELGRVDVKITVDHDKRVTAAVSADSTQTLSDLRGAARNIERALNEAGLDLAQGGLSFDLNQRRASDEQIDAAAYSDADAEDSAGAETVMIAARPFGMERWSASGVDVWA